MLEQSPLDAPGSAVPQNTFQVSTEQRGIFAFLTPPGDKVTPIVYIGIFLSMLAVLIADIETPLGVVVWVIYFVPVAMTLWVWQPLAPLLLTMLCTVLMVVTFYTDAPGVEYNLALVNRAMGVATVWGVGIVSHFFIRNKIAVRRQQWIQVGHVGLNAVTSGEQPLFQLGESVLRYLTDYLDANVGAFFVRDGGGYRRVAMQGVPLDAPIPVEFRNGDGLLGQAAKDLRTLLIRDVPDGYLSIGSALGRSNPRHLLIVPMAADRVVHAVVELGFLHSLPDSVSDFLAQVSDSIAVAVRSAQYRINLQNLLEETQRQSEELQTQGEELQAQGEELRVANEELEEQGRVLKESQARLELQQAELEQTNAQLEEQTQLLEGQKDDLERTKSTLENQARELEQASQYKSDFLANMSHELRTPLNSSLILAKLLADNPQGNLTDEQVKFAKTIQSAGNDLLALINDILDLSKIEAGRMEVRVEPFQLSQLLDSLRRTFEPIAGQKALQFSIQTAPGCPESLETDRMRLEQVLKNLLSNAIKFTEKGSVSLEMGRGRNGTVTFAIRDTGVGIPAHQQEVVFEAFRQADGTTNRKFGGTGLGLAISRELARLLGGDIQLQSEPGRGSTFIAEVPARYDAARVQPRDIEIPRKATSPPTDPPRYSPRLEAPPQAERGKPIDIPAGRLQDDREQLLDNRRVILVVEDDEAFARILYDLAHELSFQCLIATTAEEALLLAARILPHAVILDVGLPDHSGLLVLDRLKQDGRTRHIPVHVVSAGDHAQTALSLGAVGYMLKPVKRELLSEALKRLETRLERQMRRVLVVEDDPVQRESLQRLLRSHDVETVGAGSAAECLGRLSEATYDCMVLDLTLPDASGYSLLETLSREDAYSFPPVIVYTGRDLSSDEEQRLRKYSRSIIIKGAKSPERLLDEVTLFLHQVVTELPPEQQRMLEKARSRDAALEGRRILVVEDDVRNVFALTSVLEPRGATVQIARNGREALEALEKAQRNPEERIDLVLMDVMMPEMDGLTATGEIRKRPEWKKLPVIMLTAKAMQGDQQKCLAAGASDYIAKPLDVEKLLSLVRVWMPR